MTNITDVLEFVNSGNVPRGLAVAHKRMGAENLRVVAIKILSWLKSQHHIRTKRPLILSKDYPWCSQLTDWLAVDSDLAEMFSVSDSAFNFRTNVPVERQADIAALVDSQYDPPLNYRLRSS